MKTIFVSMYTNFVFNNDFLFLLKSLLNFTKYKRGPCEGDFISEIKSFYNTKVFTFNKGRSAMYVLARSLNLSSKDMILMPSFTCAAAVTPFIWNNSKIKYVDIDPVTLNLSLDKLKKTDLTNVKLVVFQHTFGNSKNIQEIADYLRSKDILLLEDCAHTIFTYSDKKKDEKIGKHGDFALFSFGQDKSVGGINGGVLLVNNDIYTESIEKLHQELEYESYIKVAKSIKAVLFYFAVRSLYTTKTLQVGKALHKFFVETNLFGNFLTKKELFSKDALNIHKLSNIISCINLRSLQNVHRHNKHRQKINKVYEDKLKNSENIQKIKYSKDNVLMRYPLLVKSKQEIVTKLAKNNYYIGTWYNTPIDPVKELDLVHFQYEKGTCDLSEAVCKSIINLPNNINVTEDDAYKIIEIINQTALGKT